MSSYLLSALEKYEMDKSVDYSLSIEDFICQCYVNLTPNSYGKRVEERIRQEIDVVRVPQSKDLGDYKASRMYIECKVSYCSRKKNTYNITHIRPWQMFNYYLLCFVDCDDNFRPHYYLVNKHVIHKMKLGYMNGTPKSNLNNHNVEYRVTINKNSDKMKSIIKGNLLEDTSLESLKKFIDSLK